MESLVQRDEGDAGVNRGPEESPDLREGGDRKALREKRETKETWGQSREMHQIVHVSANEHHEKTNSVVFE